MGNLDIYKPGLKTLEFVYFLKFIIDMRVLNAVIIVLTFFEISFASEIESIRNTASIIPLPSALENLSLEYLPPADLPQPSGESPCLSAINQNNLPEQKQDKSLLAKILMESEGGFISPTRKINLLENSELLFEPYASFSKRYEILSGSPFDKSTYEKLNGSVVNFNTCPKEYPNAPQLKEIFIIMWVIVDDYTGRTIECLLRYHLNRGTRVRVLIGEFFLTPFLKAKLEELSKIPFFEYKTIAGDFTGWLKNKNLAPHYKSMVVIGQNSKDSAVIVGGRNLSDRYYFNNRPSLQDYLNIRQRPEGNNAGAGIFNDFDIYIKDDQTALNALNVSRVLWNRLSNNWTFDLRLPLEDQLKIFYNSKEYDNLKNSPQEYQEYSAGMQPAQQQGNYWLNRVHEDLGILKDLSQTTYENKTAYHYGGLKLIPKLHSIINDDLLTKYSQREIESEIINTPKPPNDIKNLEKQEVQSSNSKLANFRIELYKKFKDAVISSGLFQKISNALNTSYFPLNFKEWYNNIYKTVDRMLFKRELFSKINDLYRLFFKPEERNPKQILDSRITTNEILSSARDFEAVKESIKQNNQYYRDFGYGTSTDVLKQLLNNPGFLYKDEISLRDYIYEKYYKKQNVQENDSKNEPFFRYFASVPGQDNLKMEKIFVDLINASKKNIRLVNCFFHPTPAIMTALKQAALRGVQIYITLNVSFEGDDDVGIPEQANAKSINEVIKLQNFHLYRWDGTILHAKVYSFDDEAMFIGSTNMNTRTFYYNGENGVFIYDKEFVNNYIKTHYNIYFIPSEKHPFENIRVSKIEKPVKEKGFIIRWLTNIFNKYL